MMVVMVVMVGGNGWCFFGWRGSRSDAFKILKRGDSNSRRGRSFGCMVVMMVVMVVMMRMSPNALRTTPHWRQSARAFIITALFCIQLAPSASSLGRAIWAHVWCWIFRVFSLGQRGIDVLGHWRGRNRA